MGDLWVTQEVISMNDKAATVTSAGLNESKRITDRLVLEPKGKDYRIMDTELTGFGIRVPAKDVSNATYIVTTKPQGGRSVKRYSIGKVSLYKTKEAREKARNWIQKIKEGIDPKKQLKRKHAKSKKLEEAFEQYLADKRLSAVSVDNYRYSMKSRLASLMTKQINNLTEEVIVSWYKKNAAETHKQTDRVFRELRAVLTHQVKLKNLESNPAELVSALGLRPKATHKTTYLTTEECGSLINEVITFRNNNARIKQTNLLLFQILTGLREKNTYNLKWSQVKLRDSVTFQETKNGDTYWLPLTALLNDILEQQRQIAPMDCEWVFPNKNFNGPTIDPRKMLNNLYQLAGINKTFRDHDLRRTFSSIADLAKVSYADIKHLMIHRKGDITERYMQSQQIKAKENYERIAELLASVTPVAAHSDEEGNEIVSYMTVDLLRLLLFNKGKLSKHPNRHDHDFLLDVSKAYYQKKVQADWD